MTRLGGREALPRARGTPVVREGWREEVAGHTPVAESVRGGCKRGCPAVADPPVTGTDGHRLHGATRQTHHRTLVNDRFQVDGGLDFPRWRAHGQGGACGGRLYKHTVLAHFVQ